jgi:hypothetical protein
MPAASARPLVARLRLKHRTQRLEDQGAIPISGALLTGWTPGDVRMIAARWRTS